MAGSLISVTGISADPLAGYTATMNFLISPEGQKIAGEINDIIVDLIKFFHSKNMASPGTTVTTMITTGTTTAAPKP